MSTTITRNFKGSATEMLTGIAAIVQAALDNEAVLTAKRASWAPPFFSNLQTEIDTVTKTWLGADNVKDLRRATQIVESIQANALKALQEIKVQAERDFRQDKTTRDEILNELGYSTYFKDAAKKDQGALVQLLFRFKQALTPALQTKLTAKGADAGTLTEITGYADTLNSANISQEAFKSSRKTATQAAKTAFNDIYAKVMDVAVIAANIFKGDAALQSRFSYIKIIKAQESESSKEKPAKKEPPVVKAAV
jgi:hypothetical protein